MFVGLFLFYFVHGFRFASAACRGPEKNATRLTISRLHSTKKLAFDGRIARQENGFDRVILLSMVYGTRGRGRPKTRIGDDIVKVCGGVCAAVEMARNRDMWRKFVKGATADRAQPNRS